MAYAMVQAEHEPGIATKKRLKIPTSFLRNILCNAFGDALKHAPGALGAKPGDILDGNLAHSMCSTACSQSATRGIEALSDS
ncbi:hypothetical protein GCM10010981_35140 [Dyella nitratireducens]|uniref:Uncharacterized protein n=1 Tax=Dyella nitratireducens TaxID=1849580 RepID=A0ABQ1GG48_9GAMM|nr:hypothetical protein GCM10010981_35140 [Dyella nitratireducens]GLQ41929.1 hypothetical protein GCM10007902_17790 [Dyella nitratireducens]